MDNLLKNNKNLKNIKTLMLIVLIIIAITSISFLANNFNKNKYLSKKDSKVLTLAEEEKRDEEEFWREYFGQQEKSEEDDSQLETNGTEETGTISSESLWDAQELKFNGLKDGEGIVENAYVNKIEDGTEFDTNDKDENGNQIDGYDSNGSNRIVRSFDVIRYDVNILLKAINNEKASTISGGYIFIEAKLPEGASTWNVDKMDWIKACYFYEVSTNKKEIRVIIKRDENEKLQNAVLNLQDFWVDVNSSKNGDKIIPTIKAWLVGTTTNVSEEEKVTVKGTDKVNQIETVTVTATPKYNVRLYKSNDLNGPRKVVNYDNQDHVGRIWGIALAVELYGENGRGVKGLEIPSGNIKINIKLNVKTGENNEVIVNKPASATKDITNEVKPILWNYSLNGGDAKIEAYKDKNNNPVYRTLNFGSSNTARSRFGTPFGRLDIARKYGGTMRSSVYDSGNVSMKQNADYSITTTISDYKFNGEFPTRTLSSTANLPSDTGCFASIYFQVFVPETENVNSYYLTIDEGDISSDAKSKTMSINEKVVTQENSNDDTISNLYGEKAVRAGDYRRSVMLYKKDTNNYLNDTNKDIDACDTTTIKGQVFDVPFTVRKHENNDEGTEIVAINKFIKFGSDEGEDKNIGIKVVEWQEDSYYKVNAGDLTDWKVWFVTKKNGKSWKDQKEKNETTIESSNICLYTSMENVPENYNVVGMYFESQNESVKTEAVEIRLRFEVQQDAEVGEVYSFIHNDIIWTKDNLEKQGINNLDRTKCTIEKENVTIDGKQINPTSTLRMPNSTNNEEYLDKEKVYPKAKAIWDGVTENSPGIYSKTTFDDFGNVSARHAGYTRGQSLRIITAKVKIDKTVTDITSDGKPKTVYDIGNNEYDINFKLIPTLTQVIISGAEPLKNTTIEIEDTLPVGLDYKSTTSTTAEPTIEKKEDGSTLLKWTIKGCNANEVIEPITYVAHINEETAQKGQKYNNKVIAKCIEAKSNSNANYEISTTSISENRFYKITDNPLIKVGEKLHYTIVLANSSPINNSDLKLVDVLPYNGDKRETNFNGEYILQSINVTNTENNSIKIYKTNELSAREKKDLGKDKTTDGIWSEVTDVSNINEKVTAFLIEGSIKAGSKIKIDIYLQPTNNKNGDKYVNKAKAYVTTNGTEDVLETANVPINVIDRSITGTVWLDSNQDGLMQNDENKIKDIIVELLDSSNKVIKTTKTNENGLYKFENLDSEKYKVRINVNDYYYLTTKGVGEDLTKNSKFSVDTKTTDEIDLSKEDTIECQDQNAGLIIQKISIKITKNWEDESNKNGKRPSSIKIQLKADGENSGEPIELKGEKDTWEHIFSNLPKYNATGKEITYTVEERETKENDLKFYQKGTPKKTAEGYTITNTFAVPDDKINLTINKVWDDESNKNGKRPSSIKMQLKADGVNYGDPMLLDGEGDTWTREIKDLKKYNESGNEIVYEVEESEANPDDLKFYGLTDTKKEGGVYTLTNKFIVPPEKISITVTKNWEADQDNKYQKRTPVELQIKNKDAIVQKYTVNETENWTHEFKNLPKYDASGNEINYTIDEVTENIYYDKTIDNTAKTITNKFKVTDDKVTSTITKKADPKEIYDEGTVIKYVIKYNAKIENYIGNAIITITDTLPYEIDETKSDINGGSYNKENKTITWTENIENINTFTQNSAKEVEIEKTITIAYKGITEDIKNLNNNVKGKITLTTTSKTDEVSANEEIDVTLKSGGVIVNHYLKDTTQKLAESETLNGKIGEKYVSKANEEVLKEYDLVEEPSNKEGTFTKEQQTVNYYYTKKKGTITVEYIDKETGENLIEKIKSTEEIGKEYTTEEKEIPYYKLVEKPENANGTYKLEEQKITYVYEKLPFNLEVGKTLTGYILNENEFSNISKLSKLELNKKEVENTVLKLKYKITVKNTGEIAGSAQVTETIPEGFTMEENLNPGWEINGNKATLTTKTIEPKEKQEYEVVLTWNKQKFGTVKNTVQISNIKNEANFEDNNQEDNQAYVEFVIGIKTGLEENATMLVLGISLQIVAVIGMKYTKKKEQLY